MAGTVLTCLGAKPNFKYGDTHTATIYPVFTGAVQISSTLYWHETMCSEFQLGKHGHCGYGKHGENPNVHVWKELISISEKR